MATHILATDSSSTLEFDDASSLWVLEKGVTYSGQPAFVNTEIDDLTFTLKGKIDSNSVGYSSVDAAEQVINIEKTGTLSSYLAGLTVNGGDLSLNNAGLIQAQAGPAIYTTGGPLTLTNSGKIVSATEAITISDSLGFKIENNGLIKSGPSSAGLLFDFSMDGELINGKDGVINSGLDSSAGGGTLHLLNEGRIGNTGKHLSSILLGDNFDIVDNRGTMRANIDAGDGTDRLINRGLLRGDVNMGGGDDFIDLHHGTYAGKAIKGGDGDDFYVVDRTDLPLIEKSGGGEDTIATSISYKLTNAPNAEFENLAAFGKRNVALTGNDIDNDLTGNSGANTLKGSGGDDLLNGKDGADALWGGKGADEFQFEAGCGKDVIHDFNRAEGDKIQIFQVVGIDEFGDLDGMIKVTAGGDTLIDLGNGDVIRLDGFDGPLGEGDFDIVKFNPPEA